MKETRIDTRYEAPRLEVVGPVAELTRDTIDKKDGPSDGLFFEGNPIANASP